MRRRLLDRGSSEVDPSRLTLVSVGGVPEGAGYLIGPHLVLTALHVVCDATLRLRNGEGVRVRIGHPTLSVALHQREAQLCWPDPDRYVPGSAESDVALLWLDEPVAPEDAGPVRWGRPRGTVPLPYEGAGFPLFAESRGPQVEYLRGALPLVSTSGLGAEGRGWVLDTAVWPEALRGAGGKAVAGSPWSGASGSSVFCDGRLVAVVAESDAAVGQRRLHAEPLYVLLGDAEFTYLLDRHGDGGLPVFEDVVAYDKSHVQTQAKVRWPVLVGTVPQAVADYEDRDQGADLAKALARQGGTLPVSSTAGHSTAGEALTTTGVLVGMGGVGKTQLAAHYTRHALATRTADLVLWTTAHDRTDVVAVYARAATAVGAAAEGTAADEAAERFLTWLEPTPGQAAVRWLVVLDDIVDPNDLAGLWPPASPYGRTLATTRRRDAALLDSGRVLIDVGVFSQGEAVRFLAARLQRYSTAEEPSELAVLAEALGCLPLALAQTAAYLADTRETSADYRALLADRTALLADVAPEAFPDQQKLALAGVWDLSVAHADTLRPVGLARPMLHLASLLSPVGIAQDVLTSQPARTYLARHRTPREEAGTPPAADGPKPSPAAGNPGGALAGVSEREARLVLSVLHRLSLADHDDGASLRPVRVHTLIQHATRDTLAGGILQDTAHAAANALLAVWPEYDRDATLVQALRADASVLRDAVDLELHHPHVHPILFRVGHSLGESGLVTAALQWWDRLYTSSDRYLGPDHPHTLAARRHLANWTGQAGDPAGAADTCTALLTDQLRLLGPDNHRTLGTRAAIAHWRGQAGDQEGAVNAYEALHADQLRLLGPDHEQTLVTRSNLITWRGGDPAAMVTAAEELLADMVRALGPDDPVTLTARGHLAAFKGKTGDTVGAIDTYEELLAAQQRVYGADHRRTLNTRSDLAAWRGYAGEPAIAAADFESVLADRLRLLGPDHPETLTNRFWLAVFRGRSGDAVGAVADLEALAVDETRVYGSPDHPQVQATTTEWLRWRRRSREAPEV